MKRMICLILTLCLLAGCSLAGAESPHFEGKPWINSNVLGNLPDERPALEDGFDMYVNYNANREARDKGLTKTLSALEAVEGTARAQIVDLCRSTTAEYPEDEILRIVWNLITDTEKRNADGWAPLMARVDRVKAVETTDGLLALLQEEGFVPCNSFFTIFIDQATENRDIFIVQSVKWNPLMDDSDAEAQKAKLVRMQYSEEEAAALVGRLQEYGDYFPLESVGWPEGTLLTIEQLKEKCPLLYAQIAGMGIVKEGPVYEVSVPEEAEAVNRFFTAENLDLFKAIIALKLYDFSLDYLDEETWKAEGSWNKAQGSGENLHEYNLLLDTAQIAVDQAYLRHFCPEEKWEMVHALFAELKDAMRNRITQNTWMDEETRQKCLEKLEPIELAPLTAMGGMYDCEPLKTALQSCSTLLDAAAVCEVFHNQCELRYAGQSYARGCHYIKNANPVMSGNGEFSSAQNIIWIGAPALNMPMFNTKSKATMLGTIGQHLAHELSHAFDSNEALKDVNGQGPLFTEETLKTFTEKVNAMIAEMNKIELFDGEMLNGTAKVSELLADLTGISLSLEVAKNTENFDYAEFFESYAVFFHDCSADREAQVAHNRSAEPHPLAYIRINYVVAQFEEFYETFPSVKEGTPMYIAPDNRIVIW